jgi:hypothetical protein
MLVNLNPPKDPPQDPDCTAKVKDTKAVEQLLAELSFRVAESLRDGVENVEEKPKISYPRS